MPIASLTSSDVSPEIFQKGGKGGEGIGYLSPVDVPVIPFSRFVVIAQHALSMIHVGQPVLVGMRGTSQRFRKPPDYKFGKSALIKMLASTNDQSGPHAEINSKLPDPLSTFPRH